MQRKPGQDLTQGPVARSLLRLTAPMILAVSSSILVQVLEIGFIGQLGTAQLAAVTFTFPISMMLTSVALGIGIGTSSLIARRVGGGDWDSVRRLATHSLMLVALLLTTLTAVGIATIYPLVQAARCARRGAAAYPQLPGHLLPRHRAVHGHDGGGQHHARHRRRTHSGVGHDRRRGAEPRYSIRS